MKSNKQIHEAIPALTNISELLTSEEYNLVLGFFKHNEEKANLWFETRNESLGGLLPLKMMIVPRLRYKLNRWIKDAISMNERL